MPKKVVVHVEDARYVGIWPSDVDGLKQLVKATQGGELCVVDKTQDGWFDAASDEAIIMVRSPAANTVRADGDYKLIAVETPNRKLAVTQTELASFTHSDNMVYVFGPHNGLQITDFSRPPDEQLYLHGYFDALDVRDVIAFVLGHRYQQLGN